MRYLEEFLTSFITTEEEALACRNDLVDMHMDSPEARARIKQQVGQE